MRTITTRWLAVVLSTLTASLGWAEQGKDPASLRAAAVEAGLDSGVMEKATVFFHERRSEITNPRYVTIIDFSLPAHVKRMWLLDLEEQTVERFHVAHGAGRDDRANPREMARFFSNTPGSRESSLGFYLTGTEYPSPSFGRAMNLHGLQETNSNAYQRRIVFHGADYVKEETAEVGRSWGCPAVDNKHADRLMDILQGGSLLFIALSDPSTADQSPSS